MMPVTATATFCATLVDEWIRVGVTTAFVAPGSRSTPLALALCDRPELAVHVMHDERSASFAALGHGLATRRPAVLLCTSGTAAAHFHAAVIESDLSCVPMLACTADRPPELWGVGAPQTISQPGLYGNAVRGFTQCNPPEDTDPGTWRSIATQSYWLAADPTRPGPVHLNLSFRDPLAGRPDALPAPAESGQSRPPQPAQPTNEELGAVVTSIVHAAAGAGGVIVAGRGQSEPSSVIQLAQRLGWPLLADHRSGARRPDGAVGHGDQLLRDPWFVEQWSPDLILRFGEPHASKELSQWITSCAAVGATVITMTPWNRSLDPELLSAAQYPENSMAQGLLERLPADLRRSPVGQRWLAADAAAEAVLEASVDVSEPVIARAAIAAVPAGGAAVVSSSMPVRDVEWFGQPRDDLSLYANRGANGIDGVISTAVGVALLGTPTVCLVGDVAFLHDANALIGLAGREVDLTIVVVHNDGGGIFGFLPQHDLLPTPTYELLFGTPHGVDLFGLCAAHEIIAAPWGTAPLEPNGLRVVVAETDREANVDRHMSLTKQIHAAVHDALADPLRQPEAPQ